MENIGGATGKVNDYDESSTEVCPSDQYYLPHLSSLSLTKADVEFNLKNKIIENKHNLVDKKGNTL